jgi:hypothetical protein
MRRPSPRRLLPLCLVLLPDEVLLPFPGCGDGLRGGGRAGSGGRARARRRGRQGAEHGRGGVDGRGPSAGARYLAVEPEVWGRDLAGRKRMDRDEREGEGARRKGRKRMDGVLEINI